VSPFISWSHALSHLGPPLLGITHSVIHNDPPHDPPSMFCMKTISAYGVPMFLMIWMMPFLHDIIPIVVSHFALSMISFHTSSSLLVVPYCISLYLPNESLLRFHPLLHATIFSTWQQPLSNSSHIFPLARLHTFEGAWWLWCFPLIPHACMDDFSLKWSLFLPYRDLGLKFLMITWRFFGSSFLQGYFGTLIKCS